MNSRIIFGVNVTSFAENSGEVQKILSEFGCSIRTRIGLHNVAEGVCDAKGLILVEFIGGAEKADSMRNKLIALKGIEVKTMEF
ncbi:MAG: hypothetical protein ACRCUY_02270 [Thermoguttaceae bacterium]